MLSLQRRYELILEAEEAFTRSIADAVFAKPVISLWMVLIPIFFLFFMFDMQKYKHGRSRFQEEYMLSRRKALALALEAVTHGTAPRIDDWIRQASVASDLEPPYREWLEAMIVYFTPLLRADGDDFKGLVQSAYADHGAFTAALKQLSAAETGFNNACRPELAATPGAMEVTDTIEARSRILRRELADAVFAHHKTP